MPDQLFRFTFEDAALRGEIVVLEDSWQAVVERHDYSAASRSYLGQALAAVTLLSGTIKFKGSLILQLQGDGPLRTLVAQATDSRRFRGMLSAAGEVPAGNLAAAMGAGRLVLSAESPKGDRYQGIVGIEAGTLAQSLESYFRDSEQLASRLWLGADDRRAAGLFLQRLPGAGESPINEEDWTRICMLADTLSERELLGLAPEEILRRLFHEETVRLYEPEGVAFRCDCSRERIARVLRGLGRDEIDAIIAEQGQVQVNCEFCNAEYLFDPVDAATLFIETGAHGAPDLTQ